MISPVIKKKKQVLPKIIINKFNESLIEIDNAFEKFGNIIDNVSSDDITEDIKRSEMELL